jgi:hypothetical protein
MMAERNAALPEAKRILYRVGVNLGDILIEGEDILGDGVNIAARLEGICEPGAICLSEDAYRQARGRIEAEFTDLGEQSLKNIAHPVRAYALTPAAIAAVKAESPAVGAAIPAVDTPKSRGVWARWPALAAALALVLLAAGAFGWRAGYAPRLLGASVEDKLANAPRLSIVVLPFENLSGDKEQDYFADGITDDLTTDLSHLNGSSLSRAARPSPTRASRLIQRRSARSSACAICSKAACAASARKWRSTPSSSRPRPEHMCGPTGSRASAASSARCKSTSSPASPIRSAPSS